MFPNFKKAAFVAASLTLVVSSPVANADDAAARTLFQQGQALFAQRGDLSKNDQAISTLAQAEAQAQDAELKYDILILESRALYFKGTHATDDASKLAIHKQGRDKADAAEQLSTSGAVDSYADAPYYAGINLARWGEANGIASSLFAVPTLKNYMNDATNRQTKAGQAGESIDGYGPDRVQGRMYKKLPFPLGSHSKSLDFLEKAVNGDPTTALNIVYLADTEIKDGSSSEQADGRSRLNALLAQNPQTLNPDRVPENIEEFQEARDVLAGKEIQ